MSKLLPGVLPRVNRLENYAGRVIGIWQSWLVEGTAVKEAGPACLEKNQPE
jgi:hypothetical protein